MVRFVLGMWALIAVACAPMREATKPEVSSEGTRLAMIKEGVTCSDVRFSPDGKAVVYSAREEVLLGTWVVLGEVRSERYSFASAPVFSPDGKIVAYGAYTVMDWGLLVVGEKTIEPGFGTPAKATYSPSGDHFGLMSAASGLVAISVRLVASPRT